jgi:predicted Zn-dependent peptidase
MSELHWSEVDGVTVVWVDTPGPVNAELLFRGGIADECATTAGHTHLAEHIALRTVHDPTRYHNGFVGYCSTGFQTTGTPEEVANSLATITSALSSLPTDSVEAEKNVLQAERSTRGAYVGNTLLTWRYGAVSYGLAGLDELAVPTATSDQLHALAARVFCRQNAVLCLSGPPPENLRLYLPEGAKLGAAARVPLQTPCPGWFVDDQTTGIGAGAIVARSVAAPVFQYIAATRLNSRLRMQQGLSYNPGINYDPLDANVAHVVFFADCDISRQEELDVAFGDYFTALQDISADEVLAAIDHIRSTRIGSLAPSRDERSIFEAWTAARAVLLDMEYESVEDLVAETDRVTLDDVFAVATEVRDSVMFALRRDARSQPWMGQAVPPVTQSMVRGRAVSSVDAPVRLEQLIVSDDGVSLLWPNGTHQTVRYSTLVAARAFQDDCIDLVGTDAVFLRVEPRLWRGGHSVCRAILEHVPTRLVLHVSGPRNVIPVTRATWPQKIRAAFVQTIDSRGTVIPNGLSKGWAAMYRLSGLVLMALGLAGVFAGGVIALAIIGEIQGGARDGVQTAVGAMAGGTCILGIFMILLGGRLRFSGGVR